jgi:hypothetical protein
MTTAIELPDELVAEAERKAAESGITLRQFFVIAIERSVKEDTRTRKDPPTFGDPNGTFKISNLTPEQIDEAMLG